MKVSSPLHTAGQISDQLNGLVIGDPALEIKGLSPIESDEANTITFFGHPRYERHIYGDQARAIIIPHSFVPKQADHITFIKVQNVYEALSQLGGLFSELDHSGKAGISPQSTIDSSAGIGNKVTISHYTVIEAGVTIGAGSILHEQVFVGKNVKIGSDTVIHSGVKIMARVEIGNRCIIYPNAVIGGEGFGHAFSKDGFKKINHQGTVIIEDEVEIGSNTCIDRGAVSDTIIRRGAKLDNLIQIAHGVEIGENVAIAAQTGVSGSSSIGSGSLIGGQVGIVGHVHIAPNSKIQAKSGVASDILEENKKWYGYPVLSYYNYLRSYAIFKRLPDLLERIRRLEKSGDKENR